MGFIFFGTASDGRVSAYIDGFNLYHALKKFGDNRVKWLDLQKLVHRLISLKTDKITSVYYFSAYAHWLPHSMGRHREYVKALRQTGVNVVLGHFKNKSRKCYQCNTTWIAHEEKETDVSIGITLLNDAYKNRFDKALLITRDSDLMPVVRLVRCEFPNLEIVAVAPPLMGHSNDLISICHSKKKISPKQVWSCLLPPLVIDQNGLPVASRPSKYDSA